VNTSDGAKRWLVVSALIVAGVWGYRRMREGPAAVLDFPRFATAWGATYFTLALVAEASPRGAAAFSLLVATGDVLAQGSQLFGDVSSAAAGTPAVPAGPSASAKAGSKRIGAYPDSHQTPSSPASHGAGSGPSGRLARLPH
jgi:hypothetical protein